MMLSTLFVSALLAGPLVEPAAPNGNNGGDYCDWNAEEHGRSGLPEADDHRFAWRRGEGWFFSDMECGHHRSDEQRRYAYQQGNVDHAEILSPDAVGSLGRVGNPFEVPVGMRGERQMAGFSGGDLSDEKGSQTSFGPFGYWAVPLFPSSPYVVAPSTTAPAADESSTQEEQGQPDYVLRTGAVFLSALTVAEIEVTRAVLERGGKEQNPLYKPFADKPGVLGLVNGAVTGGLGLIAVELNRRGKKTEARVFVWTMVVAKAVVFGWNLNQLRKS